MAAGDAGFPGVALVCGLGGVSCHAGYANVGGECCVMLGVFVAVFTVALSGLVAWSGIVGFVSWKRDCGIVGVLAGLCGIMAPLPVAMLGLGLSGLLGIVDGSGVE